MRHFTDSEFDQMVCELTAAHPSFDMLCRIAIKTLRKSVEYWCTTDSTLCGRGVEDDIMQEICIRLIKTTLRGFLIREDRNNELNRDPDGFASWIFEVAKNIKKDYANKLRAQDFHSTVLEDYEQFRMPHTKMREEEVEMSTKESLVKAFGLVFALRKKVYIKLTWMLLSLLCMHFHVTKIASTRFIEEHFSDGTLFEMWRSVASILQGMPWLCISKEQTIAMERELQKEQNGVPIGASKYCEFYMKKGGKESISDWVNKVNQLIAPLMQNESLE